MENISSSWHITFLKCQGHWRAHSACWGSVKIRDIFNAEVSPLVTYRLPPLPPAQIPLLAWFYQFGFSAKTEAEIFDLVGRPGHRICPPCVPPRGCHILRCYLKGYTSPSSVRPTAFTSPWHNVQEFTDRHPLLCRQSHEIFSGRTGSSI